MWSPIIGCSKVSPACEHCVDRAWDSRAVRPWMLRYRSAVVGSDGEWNGEVSFIPERLTEPLQQRQRSVFNVGTASDFFHKNVTEEWRTRMLEVMLLANHHHYIIPTRRIDAALVWLDGLSELPPMTLAASVENQDVADVVVPKLVQAESVRKRVDCSPLMGAVDLELWADDIDWVEVSGLYDGGTFHIEDPSWVPPIARMCQDHQIPMLFRGWGSDFKQRLTPELILASTGKSMPASAVPATAVNRVNGEYFSFWPGF